MHFARRVQNWDIAFLSKIRGWAQFELKSLSSGSELDFFNVKTFDINTFLFQFIKKSLKRKWILKMFEFEIQFTFRVDWHENLNDPNPAKITSQWAKLFDLNSKCPFHPKPLLSFSDAGVIKPQ